jgi:outer membrane beta-barrel protein
VGFLIGCFLAAGATGQPKKAPPKTPAGKPADKKPPDKEPGGEIEMSGDEKGSGSAKGSGSGSSVDPNEIDMGSDDTQKPTDLNTDMQQADQNTAVVAGGPIRKTPLSWSDIITVVRKPFLKVRRTELYPFVATTMNDNMVRHYAAGGELAYYLTDVLAIGVEGQVYQRAFREPFDLVARQARRLPTVNEYKWSSALDFHYVPVYGKFAILDRKLITWEVAFTAGIGAGQSEVVPRDTKFPGFTNFLIMPNLGGNMRFFLAKWLTVNVGVRDYIFIDKFEPTNRDAMTNATADEAKSHADSSLINNVMFQIGISFWLPTSFEYTTFR